MSAPESTLTTLRRGLALSPRLRVGLAGTLGLAVLAMVGRVAVPVAVQQGIDRGLNAPGGPDLRVIAVIVAVTVAVLALTTACSYLMLRRLFTVSETALAELRTRTFRHVHDLSMLHQQTQRRGTLVSRVTGDIDQITQFLQWGGVILLVSIGQITVTTVVMGVYSWQLTLVVLGAFVPAAVIVWRFQPRLARAYGQVRERMGALLASVSESVVGAEVIRAYGVGERTGERPDTAVEGHRRAQLRALTTSVTSFSSGEIAAGVATAGVLVVGVLMGVGGGLSVGQLTAFLFLATLFVQPVQIATEVLNEAQNAIAGWRRVLDVLDESADVADPVEDGQDLPPGPLALLPCADGSCSIVWTLPDDEAARVLALHDATFARELTTAFEARLGQVEPLGRRVAFPLRRQLASTQHQGRVLVIGDAAHAVHPLAGQGVNLGLRDVAALRESVLEARRRGSRWDSMQRLGRWARARRSDNTVAAYSFEAINRLFSNDALLPTLTRGHLLGVAGRMPPMLDLFWRRAGGA